jgi:hypothetical protein
LQKAKLNIEPRVRVGTEDTTHHICHHKLYSLTCKFDNYCEDRCPALFSCLTLTALRELDISDMGCEAKTFSDSVHAFISRSGCQLDALKLELYGLSDREFVQILSMTPMLTSLELRFFPLDCFTTSFCQDLTLCYPQPTGSDALVPRLTSLEIELDFEEWYADAERLPSPEVILAMGKSRRRPAIELEGLKVFRLWIDDYYFPPETLLFGDWVKSLFSRVTEPDIKALKEDGLQIKLEISMLTE